MQEALEVAAGKRADVVRVRLRLAAVAPRLERPPGDRDAVRRDEQVAAGL
jgi:hypothetical protein